LAKFSTITPVILPSLLALATLGGVIQIHRYLKNCSSFVICLLLAPHLSRAFSIAFFAAATVLITQTRQAVCAINQSIFLRCLCTDRNISIYDLPSKVAKASTVVTLIRLSLMVSLTSPMSLIH
jgi:hypothetical protein